MIKLDNKFSIESDPHCWKLVEMREGINPKTKEPTTTRKVTYHATLEKVCKAALVKGAEEAESLQEIIDLLKTSPKEVAKHLPITKGKEGME